MAQRTSALIELGQVNIIVAQGPGFRTARIREITLELEYPKARREPETKSLLLGLELRLCQHGGGSGHLDTFDGSLDISYRLADFTHERKDEPALIHKRLPQFNPPF